MHVRLVVHFVRNRAALTAAARRILNPARGSIRYADTITINGYCAARETSRHPLLVKLSRQRAQTVRTYLFSGDKRPRRNLTIIANGATHFVRRTTPPAAGPKTAAWSWCTPTPS